MTTQVEVIPYAVGIMQASVCTNGTVENAQQVLNDLHNPSPDYPWSLSDDVFRGHDSNTMPCDQKPTTHTHYLFEH